MLPPKVQQQPPQIQFQQQNIPYVDVQRQRQRQQSPWIGIFESVIGIAVVVMSGLMLMLGQFLAVIMIGSDQTFFSAVHEIEAILLIGLGSIGLALGTMLLRRKQN